MKDRSAQVDLMLVFAATFVTTLAFWPQAAPRQVLHCRTAESEWKTYSIAVDDPSLADIKSRLYRWKTPEFDRRYVTAKWQLEVAKFYAQSAATASDEALPTQPIEQQAGPTTFRLSDDIATVSFEMPVEAETDTTQRTGGSGSAVRSAEYVQEISPQPKSTVVHADRVSGQNENVRPTASLQEVPTAMSLDAKYWDRVIEQAERSIEATLQRTENAPVVLDKVRRSGWPSLAFHFAFLFGLGAACVYMHWLRIAPLNASVPFKMQPTSVLARLGCFGGLISFSLICLLTLWI